VALVIPSVGRVDVLPTALESARRHGAALHEIIVVARAGDEATAEIAAGRGATVVTVDRPGLAWADRIGAHAATADVVAFIDDDAELTAQWLERLMAAYQDPRVGAVGGRDLQDEGDAFHGGQDRIGTISRLGQVLGGHHAATGGLRRVAHLKGVNMSFRRELFVGFDVQHLIAGAGAQIRNELAPSLRVLRAGYDVVLDPDLVVLHHPARRAAGDERGAMASKAYEHAHNEALAFFLVGHPRRWTNLLMLTVAGYRHAPGVLRLLTGASGPLVAATVRGAWRGARTARAHRRAEAKAGRG